jgi:hypothetical protein
MHREELGRFYSFLPLELGCVTLLVSICDNTHRVLTSRKAPPSLVITVLTVFHYVGITD